MPLAIKSLAAHLGDGDPACLAGRPSRLRAVLRQAGRDAGGSAGGHRPVRRRVDDAVGACTSVARVVKHYPHLAPLAPKLGLVDEDTEPESDDQPE